MPGRLAYARGERALNSVVLVTFGICLAYARGERARCRLIQRGDGWQYEQIPIEGGVTHEYATIE